MSSICKDNYLSADTPASDMQGKYTAKEIAIFAAVADLLSQGHNPHELKVAQIAQAAGIGKGTAYEYFSSKEDILREAIHYQIQKVYKQTNNIIASASGFRQAFFRLLEFYDEMIDSHLPNIWTMMSSLDRNTFIDNSEKNLDSLRALQKQAEQQINFLMQLGLDENLIGCKTTEKERIFAYNGVISAYIVLVNNNLQQKQQLSCAGNTVKGRGKSSAKAECFDQDNDQARLMAWEMLMKMLAKTQ